MYNTRHYPHCKLLYCRRVKVDLGDPQRFHSLGKLVAEIYRTIGCQVPDFSYTPIALNYETPYQTTNFDIIQKTPVRVSFV